VRRILENGIPVIHLTESESRHPRFVAAYGFYEIAQQVGRYLAEQLGGRGQVVVAGGLLAAECAALLTDFFGTRR